MAGVLGRGPYAAALAFACPNLIYRACPKVQLEHFHKGHHLEVGVGVGVVSISVRTLGGQVHAFLDRNLANTVLRSPGENHGQVHQYEWTRWDHAQGLGPDVQLRDHVQVHAIYVEGRAVMGRPVTMEAGRLAGEGPPCTLR
eukprot:NODE_2821_length_637_cov_32.568027_g2345_i0.p3 GENE.NODE_2821_length_637_cov_32.568027_g2345_i0~~NODE_2821_length_637_cov_32.568027_g2345_i0.p3  ORF type:complete len:142 (-),score=13.67 NODE_2821_length_637_cov_32.568027_g2345_i0:3-428(-)